MAEFGGEGEGVDVLERESGFPSILAATLNPLAGRVDELRRRLEEKVVDVCAVTQCKIKRSEDVAIPGYSLWVRPQEGKNGGKEGKGGNVVLYVRDDITSTRLPIPVPPSLDVLWVRLDPRGLPADISCLVFCVVSHPYPHTSRLREPLIAHLIEVVGGIYSREPDSGVVILGDFKDFPEHRLPPDLNLQQVVTRPAQRPDAADTVITTNLTEYYRRPKTLKPLATPAHKPVLWIPK